MERDSQIIGRLQRGVPRDAAQIVAFDLQSEFGCTAVCEKNAVTITLPPDATVETREALRRFLRDTGIFEDD